MFGQHDEKHSYLCDKTVQEQCEYLNNFIIKINENIDKGIIEVIGKDKAGKNEIALTTDTHGDLMSMMGAAVMCGIKFKENEFLYYDRNKGIYYEKIDGKYYKYTPPYTGEKKEGEPIDKIAEDDSITVIPIPDTSNARTLYHLGDVIDRGQESLTSLLLCELCPNIKLAQGNHEFNFSVNLKYGYYKEVQSINLVLARMKHNGRINAVYYTGKDNDVISYSHTPLTNDDVIEFFSFLNKVYNSDVYSGEKFLKNNLSVAEFLDKEFEKQKGYEYLAKKVKDFVKEKYIDGELECEYFLDEENPEFKVIEDNFTKEEMLIIKNVVAGALIERQFEAKEDGEIIFQETTGNYFSDLYDNFTEMRREGEIINFERGYEEYAINPSVIGHTPKENEITTKGEGKCLDIDDKKSIGFDKKGDNSKKSCATVTNIDLKSGIIKHYSFVVERKVEKDKEGKENNNITDNFQKNETGHEMQILKDSKFNELRLLNLPENEEEEEIGEKKFIFETIDFYQDKKDCGQTTVKNLKELSSIIHSINFDIPNNQSEINTKNIKSLTDSLIYFVKNSDKQEFIQFLNDTFQERMKEEYSYDKTGKRVLEFFCDSFKKLAEEKEIEGFDIDIINDSADELYEKLGQIAGIEVETRSGLGNFQGLTEELGDSLSEFNDEVDLVKCY